MATRRMITSDIWDDEWFGELGFFEQALWIGLFSKCADDQGRMRDNAMLIRAAVFPYKDIDTTEIDAALQMFSESGKIVRYSVNGKEYIQLLHWWEHQRPQWASPSKYQPPVGWVDRVRTNINREYIEINWKDKDYENALSQVDSPGGCPGGEPTLPSGVGRQYPVPVPVPVPNPIPPSNEGGSPSPNGDGDAEASPSQVNRNGTSQFTTFQDWSDYIHKSKNKSAAIATMLNHLYPCVRGSPVDFGMIGTTARSVGGFGRLADLLWQHSTRPPTGDPLKFILASHQRISKREREMAREHADGQSYIGGKYADLIKH